MNAGASQPPAMPPFNRGRRDAIAGCGQMCEYSLAHAAHEQSIGREAAARTWRERAEWWSDQAFRQASP